MDCFWGSHGRFFCPATSRPVVPSGVLRDGFRSGSRLTTRRRPRWVYRLPAVGTFFSPPRVGSRHVRACGGGERVRRERPEAPSARVRRGRVRRPGPAGVRDRHPHPALLGVVVRRERPVHRAACGLVFARAVRERAVPRPHQRPVRAAAGDRRVPARWRGRVDGVRGRGRALAGVRRAHHGRRGRGEHRGRWRRRSSHSSGARSRTTDCAGSSSRPSS